MNDNPLTNDAAERLRRLQERRAASGRPSPTPSNTDGSTATPPAAPSTRTRRRHPAATTRIVLAGLSVTSFFSVATAIAVANRSTGAAQSVAASTASTNNPAAASNAGAQTGNAGSVVVHTATRGS
jgi:hypothetical protein